MKKLALIVGHSKQSQGAQDPNTGITEFQFNSKVAERVKDYAKDFEVVVVYRGKFYSQLPCRNHPSLPVNHIRLRRHT